MTEFLGINFSRKCKYKPFNYLVLKDEYLYGLGGNTVEFDDCLYENHRGDICLKGRNSCVYYVNQIDYNKTVICNNKSRRFINIDGITYSPDLNIYQNYIERD